jgi:hypothetical protein
MNLIMLLVYSQRKLFDFLKKKCAIVHLNMQNYHVYKLIKDELGYSIPD